MGGVHCTPATQESGVDGDRSEPQRRGLLRFITDAHSGRRPSTRSSSRVRSFYGGGNTVPISQSEASVWAAVLLLSFSAGKLPHVHMAREQSRPAQHAPTLGDQSTGTAGKTSGGRKRGSSPHCCENTSHHGDSVPGAWEHLAD